MSISYKESGVDIDAGAKLVEEIKPYVQATFNENVLGNIGGFAGGFALPKGYKEPVLFGATDGVGTKLKLAIEAKKFDTVGIDLVAMCVNDLICSFAEPLFFLDYYATAKLDVDEAKEVIKGIAKGCEEAQCALIGGETAEMPGMYREGDFDLAGFSVGIAERNELENRPELKAGDILVALPSSGIHSNGYSLVRKLFFEKLGKSLDDEFNGKPLKEVLLEPTRIYVQTYKKLKNHIKALAHITGGGIVENLPRVLPNNLKAVIEKNKIQTLPIFDFIAQYVDEEEMYKTFNMGVGMILVIDPKDVDAVLEQSDGYIIGSLQEGTKGVELL
ncbi:MULTISPECIES: phosphoribosylformylglycinamidine cyclo-ligase [unclassified Nitratiruptor]|uniref:phosphoribosylformylglycinamidine cyclo-ligase n=1 Tax=unclassified Nitratiruptor TaxID=2624044 RepID=UPI0019152903|nr:MULTISPECIES: phosphoribosylformylglycinamidine cyclo-ligase [unclassified Nitratiruptor]BCD59372.1 phosphoribosylformylglycinamidine cyclo-ligase [Nitratiruptor sp. YY08-10]BCD63296.1 phosphoribosylformylglycinamidine cyclo-ligase [Nitratiruptor sp. YY08-14]